MHKKERKKSTFWKDFKAFISRGNIVDLAVGLVVGAAFTAIVNSLVNDIIKPLIALLVNGDFSELVVVLREAVYDTDGVTVLQEAITLNYGNLIMAILTFLIDAFVIFTVLRIVTKAKNRLKEESVKLKEKLMKAEDAEENAEQAAEIAEARRILRPSRSPRLPWSSSLRRSGIFLRRRRKAKPRRRKKTRNKMQTKRLTVLSSVFPYRKKISEQKISEKCVQTVLQNALL